MEHLSQDAVAYYARRAAECESIYAKPERQADLAELRTRLRDVFENARTVSRSPR